MPRIGLAAFIILLGLAGPAGADYGSSPTKGRPAVLTLSTEDEAPDSMPGDRGFCDRVVTLALRRLGIKAKIVRLPSERALRNADDGLEDGTFSRVGGTVITSGYPNLVLVPEPLIRFDFVAFAKDANPKIEGWQSLAPYRVGIVSGWKILEQESTVARAVFTAHEADALLRMLAAGRIDLAIYDRQQGLYLIRALGLTALHPLAPPLMRQDMYLYLHRRYQALVPGLTEALAQMKRDGAYQAIVQKTEEELKQGP